MKNLVDIIIEAKYESPSIYDLKFIDAYNPKTSKIKSDAVSGLQRYSRGNCEYANYNLSTSMPNDKDIYNLYKPFKIGSEKLLEYWDEINSDPNVELFDVLDLLYLDNDEYNKGISYQDLKSNIKLTIIPYTMGNNTFGAFIIDSVGKRCTNMYIFDKHYPGVDTNKLSKLLKISNKNWLISSEYNEDKPWERIVVPVEFALQKHLN